jgi:hypothetical protein
MMIVVGIAAVVVVCLLNRSATRRNNRPDTMGLRSYGHRAQCEESFPFDYLSR